MLKAYNLMLYYSICTEGNIESGEVLRYTISDLHCTEGENNKYFVEMKCMNVPKFMKE
jgi:hypothetical protein